MIQEKYLDRVRQDSYNCFYKYGKSDAEDMMSAAVSSESGALAGSPVGKGR